MWIIIRFFGLLIVWNQWLKFRKKRYEKQAADKLKINNRDVFVYFETKLFTYKKTFIGVPLKRSSHFKIHPETESDRFFKSWGLSTELQTNDLKFDQRVYLETDAKALVKELGDNKRAREIIQDIFFNQGLEITADTDWLEVKLDGERRDTDEIQKLLVELAEWLDSVPSKTYAHFKDPQFFKALTAEFIFTGIAFYGIFSFGLDLFQNRLIDTGLLMSKATKFTLVAFLVLIPFNFWFLKGSARGHRLILENFFYIIIGVPLACFYLVSDANQAWDKKESQSYELPVVMRMESNRSYTRPWRRSWSRSFSMRIDLSPLGLNRTKRVSISRKDYQTNASYVTVDVGQGYFNQRYIKKIDIAE